MTQIKKAGYRLDNEMQTLAQIAQQNGVPPQRIYDAMRSAGDMPVAAVQDSPQMPDTPPPGTGNLTLADVCQPYGLNMKLVIRALDQQGLAATEEMTLKKIGEKHGIHPTAVYTVVILPQISCMDLHTRCSIGPLEFPLQDVKIQVSGTERFVLSNFI